MNLIISECEKIEALIERFQEGNLDDFEKEIIIDHICGGCKACERSLELTSLYVKIMNDSFDDEDLGPCLDDGSIENINSFLKFMKSIGCPDPDNQIGLH